jgi:hypothetical protein
MVEGVRVKQKSDNQSHREKEKEKDRDSGVGVAVLYFYIGINETLGKDTLSLYRRSPCVLLVVFIPVVKENRLERGGYMPGNSSPCFSKGGGGRSAGHQFS